MAGPERDIRSRSGCRAGPGGRHSGRGGATGAAGVGSPEAGRAGAGFRPAPARLGQWDQRQRPVVERVGALALALPFNSGLLGASVVVLPSLARDCAFRAFLPWAASVS